MLSSNEAFGVLLLWLPPLCGQASRGGGTFRAGVGMTRAGWGTTRPPRNPGPRLPRHAHATHVVAPTPATPPPRAAQFNSVGDGARCYNNNRNPNRSVGEPAEGSLTGSVGSNARTVPPSVYRTRCSSGPPREMTTTFLSDCLSTHKYKQNF